MRRSWLLLFTGPVVIFIFGVGNDPDGPWATTAALITLTLWGVWLNRKGTKKQ